MSDEAIAQKNLGNEAYKKRDFATAHKHYDAAIALSPKTCTFYTNKAAAYFEEGKYEDCIEQCKTAIDIGRANKADYTQIAKSMARIANAYVKLANLKDAIYWFEKSLAEHRDPDVVKRYNQVNKELKEQELKAYINPEISEEEKVKGNALFQKGDFPGALKHYNEAIKRNPENHVLYSNRAACYQKLMEFPKVIDDCDLCLKKDPKFIKAYLRKGAALLAMREFGRAKAQYEEALNIDPNSREAQEGLANVYRLDDEDPAKARERAMQDPAIQEILRDPGMRMILEQMSTDPGAVQEHLKNPEVLTKLMKLKEAGIIAMR
uniref:Stress-induced-phosphoprotein 1 n=1 Tax=Panagrellus redivivus TaxID=6233 RepID=A0A7E4VC69_PANRE